MKQLILILVALMLTGCLSVAVKPDQVAKTNRFFEGETLNGNSARTAHVEGFMFADERLDTSFGKLHTVVAQSNARRPLIVFCGGNAYREDLGGAKRMEALAPFGDVMFFDYPGLGSSDGSGVAADYRATETAVLARTEALAAERGTSSVIFWGHSLGGGVCSSLAAQEFHLITELRLDAPIEAIWQVLSEVEAWPEWRPTVKRVELLRAGDGDGIGAVRRMTWRTALPYSLGFDMTTTRVHPMTLIEGRASGKMGGAGR